ncbi:MAG: RnfABCDGE type electron transport complex subunit D [Spartobacteria bacterium]|nr:RnfABCDGE type electron transport complex subunit D [Spartobacteria bacterium]
MTEENKIPEAAGPVIHVSPGPHIHSAALTTRRMMLDVLLALLPAVLVAFWVFGGYALAQIVYALAGCLGAEALFTAMRKKPFSLMDGSAAVTGVILALSMPATAPWYVGVIAGFAAIGLGKVIFGGLGNNIFNPAMVGRAFVMIAFATLMGASAYVDPDSSIQALTRATPMTAIKMMHETTPLSALLIGNTNGSLGETSAIACILGGVYLLWRRTASWEIPAGVLLAVAVISGAISVLHPDSSWGVLHSLTGGALLFGAFFIATDPVSSPVTPKGKWIFGVGIGIFIMILRTLSGYPEGVMFAVLLMNAVVPLINRWTIPTPVGGPVPVRK